MVLEKEWEELFPTLSKIHQEFELGFAEAGDEDLCCVSDWEDFSVCIFRHIAVLRLQSLLDFSPVKSVLGLQSLKTMSTFIVLPETRLISQSFDVYRI